jgi:hypothetical protein
MKSLNIRMNDETYKKVEEFIKQYGTKYVWQIDDALIGFIDELLAIEKRK